MSSHFVALSDLHLGYDLSVLNERKAQEHLVAEIKELCGGQTDRLILNGDCFEACVPLDAGEHDRHGFPPKMAEASRNFFERFTSEIDCSSLVIVWGNHDYAMWQRLAASCNVPVFTNDLKGDVLLQRDGFILPGAEGFLEGVIGPVAATNLSRIRSAYPNYVLGRYWPYIVFHHGHLLDELVLGASSEATYLGLRLMIGEGKPKVFVGGDETIKSLHDKTKAFIGAMWRFNSHAREHEWSLIRRSNQATRCPSFPQAPAPSSAPIISSECQDEGLGRFAPWYVNTLMADATTPGAIGSTDHPCYLFIGHDHCGGSKDISAMDGRRWKLINTGGWTSEGGCKELHSHVVVWNSDAETPNVSCVRTYVRPEDAK
jgi:hypothetical protein